MCNNRDAVVVGKEALGMLADDGFAYLSVYFSSYTQECTDISLKKSTAMIEIYLGEKSARDDCHVGVVSIIITKVRLETLNTIDAIVLTTNLNCFVGRGHHGLIEALHRPEVKFHRTA